MWSLWRSRNRFSLDELKYLHGQLQKIQFVNDTNKALVIETLRSIAEIVTYGDQHDPSIFEYFMDKQIMNQFLWILKVSSTTSVAIQLLQTLSIMIQNLHSEHAIYYLFSNEHVNSLILHPFDFSNEEVLNYYIYFLRAVSGRLDKNTISLLVKTKRDEVISFPLYTEAIKFVHHEENMVRIAVRALTLNIYHVTDESIHRFITSPPLADYFLNLVKILEEQCVKLNTLVLEALKPSDASELNEKLYTVLAEIGDNLCYCNDIICAGDPRLSKIMAHHLLHNFILPVLIPSVSSTYPNDNLMNARTSLYMLSVILKEICNKDLANSIGAALLYSPTIFRPTSKLECNGKETIEDKFKKVLNLSDIDCDKDESPSCSPDSNPSKDSGKRMKSTLREILLSYLCCDDEKLIIGSLNLFISLLQNKELDDSVLDSLGILPQKKQHKKHLLQRLIGSKSDEEQLFSPSFRGSKDEMCNGLGVYLQKKEERFCIPTHSFDQVTDPVIHRSQVLDSLISLICNGNPAYTEPLWHAGYLLRQLLPYESQKLSDSRYNLLKDAYDISSSKLLKEIKDCWCDLVAQALLDEWKKCKKVLETPDLERCSTLILLPDKRCILPDDDQSSFAIGERLKQVVKIFAFHRQLRHILQKEAIPEVPQISSVTGITEDSRLRRAGLDVGIPKIGSEINLCDAIPCRIAFERGKERHFYFLAVSKGVSGCLVLAEEVPFKPERGIVRIVAPLAGASPRIDEKHRRWLHLRIRPFNIPSLDSKKGGATPNKSKSKGVVDGRWILAFLDEASCQHAKNAITEEMSSQWAAAQKEIEPLLK